MYEWPNITELRNQTLLEKTVAIKKGARTEATGEQVMKTIRRESGRNLLSQVQLTQCKTLETSKSFASILTMQ